MTLAEPPTSSDTTAPLRAGAPIDPVAFEQVRRRMMLDHCKWDPQVGDVATLAEFPLILSCDAWDELRASGEALARETIAMEQRLLHRPDLWKQIGLPRTLRRVLRDGREATPSACRVMRFDFLPTHAGWRISEVNSDVPGGYSEASAFTQLVAEHVDNAEVAGDPLTAFVDALPRRGAIGLLVAPGFMEDQQVVSIVARELHRRGTQSVIAHPRQLSWRDGGCTISGADIAAIVRFYQGEWLSRLPRRTGWQHLFVGGRTPVANPGVAILAESKRLPLVWDELGVACLTWRRLLPETRDPRDAPWRRDESWLLKTAYCNTGDSVTIRSLLPTKTWRRRCLDIWLNSTSWLAQRRLELEPIDTPRGPMFPCVGVFVIDGCACGLYGRLSSGPVTTYSAVDVAVLVEHERGVTRDDA